jgi:hypothetical protein
MKKAMQILKWIFSIFTILLIVIVLYMRFGRVLDSQIYRADYSNKEIDTEFNFNEMFFTLNDGTKIHSALFKPNDSIKIKATIIHHLGNGMSLNDSQKIFYSPLIKEGFQIFAYERRGYGKSSGKSDNSLTLRNDADEIFEQMIKLEEVKNSKIIVWGTSIGGIFATANASSKNNKISGLIIESTFSSFPKIAQFYASEINLKRVKFLIPLIINNDFPTTQEIKKIDKPVVIIHSTEDTKIPFEFAEDIYNHSNKETTEFWKIKGQHVHGIINYEKEYVEKFKNMIRK